MWPTKSTDPGVNLVVAAFILFGIVFAVTAGVLILVPILIAVGVAKGVHWYLTLPPRPTTTQELVERAKAVALTTNFPDDQGFLEYHLTTLMDSWGDNPL